MVENEELGLLKVAEIVLISPGKPIISFETITADTRMQ